MDHPVYLGIGIPWWYRSWYRETLDKQATANHWVYRRYYQVLNNDSHVSIEYDVSMFADLLRLDYEIILSWQYYSKVGTNMLLLNGNCNLPDIVSIALMSQPTLTYYDVVTNWSKQRFRKFKEVARYLILL